MTRNQKGCYMDLLNAQFHNGPLSLDEIKTVLAGDFGSSWPTLQKKFERDESGRFFNARLKEERDKRRLYSESRRNNAHMNKHMRSHMVKHMENENRNEIKDEKLLKDFEKFWTLYPFRNGKKLLKKDALKQFSKLDEAMHPQIFEAVKNYVKSGQMPRDAVRFLKDDFWREWIAPVPIAEKLSVKTEMPDRTTQPRWEYPPEAQALIKKAIPRVSA